MRLRYPIGRETELLVEYPDTKLESSEDAEFTGPAGDWRDFNGPVSQFMTQKNQAWNQYLVSNYGPVSIYFGGSRGGCAYFDDKDSKEKSLQNLLAEPRIPGETIKTVQWP